MNNYNQITNLPIYGHYFGDWEKKDARNFWKEILSRKTERLYQLLNLIHQDPEYINFRFDYTIESLIPIGEWMKKNITIEPKSKELYDKEAVQLRKFATNPTSFVLSSRTRSICLDVSLYYGEIMLKKLGDRDWHIYTDTSKNNIFFGAMGIKVKTKNILFYPLSIVVGYALQILEDTSKIWTLESMLKTQLNTIIEIESRSIT